MKLNHLDLQVSDVGQSVAFLETYFDFELRSKRGSPAIAILSDREGFTLVLQRKKPDDAGYPADFHFGFLVDDPAAVHAFQAHARANGIEVSDVIENGRGTLVYCRPAYLPMIEVSCRR
ncbi:MAG: VOC family protein [Polyangiales bacterium]